MPKRIAIVQGHPDRGEKHFGHALAAAYAQGAAAGGHEVKVITPAELDFPVLRSQREWESQPLPASLREAQEVLGWADHIVLVFPLWLGTMPALLKAFLEQVLRPGFAFHRDARATGTGWKQALKGKTARLVVTMGMPAFWYRWFFRAHGVEGLRRNILQFCGIGPVKESFIGMVEAKDRSAREKWLAKLEALGRRSL